MMRLLEDFGYCEKGGNHLMRDDFLTNWFTIQSLDLNSNLSYNGWTDRKIHLMSSDLDSVKTPASRTSSSLERENMVSARKL